MRRIPLLPLLLGSALSASAADTLDITNIHTRSANWLSIAVHPLEGCQGIAVDSVKIADQPTVTAEGTITVFLGPPRRRLELWWHVDSLRKGWMCETRSRGARHLLRLSDPRKSPGNDTLLRSWIVEDVVSHGPDGGSPLVPVALVDQAGDQDGRLCPVYDCYYYLDTVAPPVEEVRDSLESWIRVDGSLVLATSGGTSELVAGDIQDSDLVQDLGRVSPWNLGNLAWREFQPIRVLQSWGEPVPARFVKPTGRRFYNWTGTGGGACCLHCDTICDFFAPNDAVVYTGGNLFLSNDSTASCRSEIDQGMYSALDSRWLLRPLRAEVASGVLATTFSTPGVCGGPGRIRAFRVVGDSLQYRAGSYALADLLPVSGNRVRNPIRGVSIRSVPNGWIVSGAEGTTIRLRDLDGRILFQAPGSGNPLVPAPRHGAFLLQVGRATSRVVR